jgi:hypothetical protein
MTHDLLTRHARGPDLGGLLSGLRRWLCLLRLMLLFCWRGEWQLCALPLMSLWVRNGTMQSVFEESYESWVYELDAFTRPVY